MDIPKFFERKKRELSSNNSTEEEASLKKREENSGHSIVLETDDIFSQGLKSSEYLKILFNYLQILETETKTIKNWQIKGTKQLNDMNKVTHFIKD